MAYIIQISDTDYTHYPAPNIGDIFIVTEITGGLSDAPEYLRDYGKRIRLTPAHLDGYTKLLVHEQQVSHRLSPEPTCAVCAARPVYEVKEHTWLLPPLS